jgi:hypothetical protein
MSLRYACWRLCRDRITGCGPAGAAEMLKLYRAEDSGSEEWLYLAKVRLDSMVATAVRQSLIYFCDQAISVTILFKAISVSLTNDNGQKT